MIPIAKPYLGEEETQAVAEVLQSGWVTQGPKVQAFEADFSEYVGSQYACAVSSCTTALHLALLAVGVQPGDIVLTASHSFIATANVIRHCGAEPVFVDIELQTFNLDPIELERVLTEDCELREGALYYKSVDLLATGESPLQYIKESKQGRVSAVLVVHQLGMPCDLAQILAIAKRFNLPIVEDAACASGSEISLDQGQNWEMIGKAHGEIACFSFHPRKILTTGDGGMITSSNPKFEEQFRLLRQHGMGIPDTLRHQSKSVLIESYLTTGYNYRLTDIQAAIGIEQLKRLPAFLSHRRYIDAYYREQLSEISWLQLPVIPDYARPNWQSYPVYIHKGAPLDRNAFMQALLERGISTRPGVMNAHKEAPYQNHPYTLPQSEAARDNVLMLPVYHDLRGEMLKTITDVIHSLALAYH